jgi:hypothetical protein
MKNRQKSSKNHHAKKSYFLTQKTHRRGHGNKTAFFQKKRVFAMLKSSFLTQKPAFT